MEENIDDIINRINKKHLPQKEAKPGSRYIKIGTNALKSGASYIGKGILKPAEVGRDFLSRHKRLSLGISIPLVVGGLTFSYLVVEYLFSRQNYPERNVVFRCSQEINIAGSQTKKLTSGADIVSTSKFNETGGELSKIGTTLFTTVRDTTSDIEHFNMYDTQNKRMASAEKKQELVQGGPRRGGYLNFKEQIANISPEGIKARVEYATYKFVPQRGLREPEVTVLLQSDGVARVINKMTELRSRLFGYFGGKEYRGGTFLEDYVLSDTNKSSMEQFFINIKTLDSDELKDKPDEREKLIHKLIDLENKMQKRWIYASYEEGIIDLLPQESTVYLGHNPSLWDRIKKKIGFPHNKGPWFRIENYWDLLPWKALNGGYIIEDKFGEVAKVDIKDFWLFYGNDLLYSYYLDLNGDGKIDKKTELINQVLCRTSHDEMMNLRKILRGKRPKADMTIHMNYSFMAPNSDQSKWPESVNYAGFIESCMADAINHGFGQHSLLGCINDPRSDYMLWKMFELLNLSRSLTQESSLVAENDIINVLIKTKRPYAKELAEMYGISDKFEGMYDTSPLLHERTYYRPYKLMGFSFLAVAAGCFFIYRRMNQKQLKQK